MSAEVEMGGRHEKMTLHGVPLEFLAGPYDD